MSDDVIAAVYAEWQMVKTRSVLVLKFEVPIDQTEHVMTVLGIPRPDQEHWYAITRLIDGAVQQKKSVVLGADRALRQCHAVCHEFKFQHWIVKHPYFGIRTTHGDCPEVNEANARLAILDYCKIKSRGDLLTSRGALEAWDELIGAFQKETGIAP